MITIFFFLCYLILFSFVLFNLFNYYKKNKKLNGYVFFHVSFLIYYVIIPLIYFLYVKSSSNSFDGFLEMIIESEENAIYALLYTVIFYFTFYSFYNYVFFNNKSLNCYKNKNALTNKKESTDKRKYYLALISGCVTLFIGLVAEFIIASSLGGFGNAIKMGDQLRAFNGDASYFIPQNKLFFIVLMVFILASPYFFAYALSIYKSFMVKVLFIISLVGSLFYLLFNAGRLGLILFVLTFFLGFTLKQLKYPILYTFIFSIIILITIDLLDQLFFYLSYNYVKESTGSSINELINEFAFPYLNLLNVGEINSIYGLRWGLDYMSWIINIIPTSFLQQFSLTKITPGYFYITHYYFGANPLGGVPTDILTLGMRQFGLTGMFFLSVALAFICSKIDSVINQFSNQSSQVVTLRAGMIMFIIIPYADLDSFVRNRFDMLLVLIFILVITWVNTKIEKET